MYAYVLHSQRCALGTIRSSTRNTYRETLYIYIFQN